MSTAIRFPGWRRGDFVFLALAALAAALLVHPPIELGRVKPTPELLAIAKTILLTIELPLYFWLCVLRPRRRTIADAIPVAAAGLLIARFLAVPAVDETLLPLSVLIGALQAGYLLSALRSGRRRARKAKLERTGDLLGDRLAWVRAAWPGKRVPQALAYEMLAIYYAFGVLPKPREGFTYHRAGGIRLLLGVGVGLGLIEATVLHLVLNAWSPVVAWLVVGLELYGLVWIVGLIRSLLRTAARGDSLRITNTRSGAGLRSSCRVPSGQVTRSDSISASPPSPKVRGSSTWER